MTPVLLDTGPVVALLKATDAQHKFVRETLSLLPRKTPFMTTGAVISEIMFHLQNKKEGTRQAARFLEEVNVVVEDIFSPPDLRMAADLMEKYADLPMDYADATLVLLAERFQTGDILTLDERGFRTYRFLKNRGFRLLLQDGYPEA